MRKEKSYSFPAILAAVAILLAYLCRITTKFGFELSLQEELILPLTLLRSMIYLCLFMAWGISLKMRIQQKQVQKYMIGAAVLIVFWIFVRSLRFMIFTVPPAPRYLWYMYYLPLLALPTSALMVALSIGKSDDYRQFDCDARRRLSRNACSCQRVRAALPGNLERVHDPDPDQD